MDVDDNILAIVPQYGTKADSKQASPVQEHTLERQQGSKVNAPPNDQPDSLGQKMMPNGSNGAESVVQAREVHSTEYSARSYLNTGQETSLHPSAKAHRDAGPVTPQSQRQHRQRRSKPSKALSQADLLDLLAFRMQQDDKAQAAKVDDLKRANEELEHSKGENRILSARVDELQGREAAYEEKIDTYHRSVVSLKAKAKKVDDYLRGLTNDYHKLRDSSRRILETQDVLVDDKRKIDSSIAESNTTLEQVRVSTTNTFAQNREDIFELQLSLQLSQKELELSSQLIEEERQRSHRLELEIVQLSSAQQKMNEDINVHAQRADAGFKSLVEHKDHLTAIISGLVSALDGIKSRLNFDKADLEKIDLSFRDFAAKIAESLDQSAEKSSSAQLESSRIAESIGQALSDLEKSFQSEQTWAEQLSAAKEELIGLKGTLQFKASEIETLKGMVSDFQGGEKAHHQETTTLQAQIVLLQSQVEDATLTSKLQELETLNIQKDDDISALRLKSNEFAATLQERDDLVRNRDDELLQVKTQLSEAERSTELAVKQVAAFADMNSDLLKAANAERVRLRQKHTKVTADLKQEKESVEGSLRELRKELETAQRSCNKKVMSVLLICMCWC